MSSKDFLPDIMSHECHHAMCYEKAEVALDWGWFIPCSRGATESVELSLKIGMIFLSKGVDGRGQG